MGVGDWNEYIARRGGKEWHTHPKRQQYMNETQGTMTYQEQFLLDCKTFAKWGIAFADKNVRKNKDIRNDVELKEKFYADCKGNGYNETLYTSIWNEIMDAVDGGYSFNKAHSTSYAMLSYQTAWLKCHYPNHFYASLMTIEGSDNDAVSGYMAECKKRGITILPPDINESNDDFVATSEGIRYRITTIKNVGNTAIKFIDRNKPFSSFDDFMDRRVKKSVNKTCVRNLIKAGAFDFDEPNRAELMWRYDMREERTKTQIKNNYQCEKYEYNDKVKMEWEKDALGMYLSVHPMEKYSFKRLEEYKDGESCLVAGEVIDIAEITDKNDNKMAFVTLDTLFGNVKIVVFASAWKRKDVAPFIEEGIILMIRGKRSGNDVLFNSMEILD